MEKSQHRHDISDKAWAILEPMLPGQRGQWGGIAEDNRRFINGVFWILRTGAPWRDLPPDYGKWGSCRERFSVVKTLERDRYALCEKYFLFPFCCSYQVYRYLAGCFGLISGRHYLILSIIPRNLYFGRSLMKK